jgi:hypothetical protein
LRVRENFEARHAPVAIGYDKAVSIRDYQGRLINFTLLGNVQSQFAHMLFAIVEKPCHGRRFVVEFPMAVIGAINNQVR